MEDFRIDIMVGRQPSATGIPLDLAPFTLVGATTRSGLLPNPLRDRFASPRTWSTTNRGTRAGRGEIGGRAGRRRSGGGTRRDRTTLARNTPHREPPPPASGYVVVHGGGESDAASGRRGGAATEHDVSAALDLYDVDAIGLDRLDRAVLDAVVRQFRGGPVGLSTLAVTVGEEAETIESVVEPYLVRIRIHSDAPRGRIAAPEAYVHLRVPQPGGSPEIR